MTVFRRTTTGETQPSTPIDKLNRLARFAGRVLLWGCVLLLLVRGMASYFDTTSRVPTTTRGATVTVTQPASTETSQAQGK
jgi:hypothetical protein